MSSSVTVRKVESPADYRAFFEFPWTLYKDDPYWTPPLLSMRRDLLDQKKSPSWEYMEGDYFAAWRGDKIVGTIAAYINPRHNEFHEEHIGWFGAFDVYDDQEAATALLNTAADWVRERGYDAIRGPQSFTTHEECGLLVDGFVRPILLMPYNAPYYQGLVENAGFTKAMDVYSFYADRDGIMNGKERKRIARLTERIMQRNKITIRPLDPKRKKAEFELFKEIYNAAWEKNWGFVPMTPRELDALVASLGQFVEPQLALFAEVDGKPAGFIMAVPDFNQLLQKVYPRPGVPEIASLLQILWHWKIRPSIDWIRIPLMGVKQEFRNMGVDASMYYHMTQAIVNHTNYQHSDSGWILENNENMVSIAKNLGTEIYKTHRFYEKRFK
ncbi:MAG: GNAT family N-acetyltransferase [Anaerolineaceae bacterium]|nr:GNAT family N-acetyltransferase [Anaerolineaceae bacterium]